MDTKKWFVVEGDSTTLYIDDEFGFDGGRNYYLAEVKHGDPAELKANAHLIAAAPELLEALEAAKVYVTCAYECAFPDEQRNDLVLQMIEEAIAKAKGEEKK